MKIKKTIKMLITLSKSFGALFTMKCLGLRLISFSAYERNIYDYLRLFFSPLIEKYNKSSTTQGENTVTNYKVWTLWWQGEKDAPEIVKVCLNSQRRAFKKIGAEIVLLDRYNWNQYIDLPDYIHAKVTSGDITLTHFSDIIRAALLNKYGGLWIDATVYCIKPITDQSIFNRFYTVKTQEKSNGLTIGRWTGFLLGGPSHQKLFSFMEDCFNYYWKEKTALIAYLLIDYIMAIANEAFTEVKQAVNEIQVTNTGMWNMLKKMNAEYCENKWNDLGDNTTFVKLSYKDEFNGGPLKEYTKNGRITNWGYLQKMEREYRQKM